MLLHDQWLLTPHRAAIHLPTRTAVLADLHLGYADVRRAAGDAIPNWEWPAAQARLAALLDQHRIERIVVAGDLVEHARWPESAERMIAWLRSRNIAVTLVPGNHDRGLAPIEGLEVVCAELETLRSRPEASLRASGLEPQKLEDSLLGVALLGDWRVQHEANIQDPGKLVAGHEHPVVRLARKDGSAFQTPCFLSRANRLILPAFSEDAAGLNVLGSKEWRGYRCHAIIGEEVLDLGLVSTLRSRLQKASSRRRSFWHAVTAFKTRT